MLFSDNEIGIFISGVLIYLFIILQKKLKEYGGFSKEIREEVEKIIDENMKGKVKYGVFLSIILSLMLWFKVEGGYIGLSSEDVLIPQLYFFTKNFIRFLNLISLFWGIFLIYLIIQLHNIKLKKEISFLAKLNYMGIGYCYFLSSLIMSESFPLILKMIVSKMLWLIQKLYIREFCWC